MAEVDLFAKNLHDSLEARNLTDIVDVVFVSDHGMTDTSHPEHIFIDDILGKDGMAAIEHRDGWPSMGLRLKPQSNMTKFLDTVLAASARNPEKFDVYTHDTMPERYHFSHNERIAPIYVIPRIGYVLTTHAEGTDGINKGVGVLFLSASYTVSKMGHTRAMDTTTRSWLCRPCSSHTVRSPRPSRTCINGPLAARPAGTPLVMIHTS